MTAEPPATPRTDVDVLDRHPADRTGAGATAGAGTGPHDDGHLPGPADDPATDTLSGPLGRARRIGWVLIGLQLVAMVAFSTVQYHRFALTSDFGSYSQGWWKIAHGQLDPWSSVFATPFWRNDAEFAMWPLAALFWVYPHSVVLLWVQDLAVAVAELVALAWVVDVLHRSRQRISPALGVGLAVGAASIMVADPWAYQTIAFDVHFEVLAAALVVAVGRDLWAGRTRRLWWWAVPALLSSVLGALYLLGVGISGILAGKRTRRSGWALAAVGAGWFVLMSSIGAVGLNGRLVDSGYAYLVGSHTPVDLASLVTGVLGHPGSVLRMVGGRWPIVFEFLVAVGLIGVISPWGFGMALVVFLPSAMDSSPWFLRPDQAFQSWPALPFVLVGSVMVIVRLGAAGRRRLSMALVAAWGTAVVVLAAAAIPTTTGWIAVDAPAAAQLNRATSLIPPGAEVIASQGVVGRFTDRQDAFTFPLYGATGAAATTFPVQRPVVVFVLAPRQGVSEAPPAETAEAVRYIEHRLGARVVDAGAGVAVLEWSARGARHVTLP